MIAFDRAWKVTVFRQPSGLIGANPSFFDELGNGVEITKLRVVFKVERTLDASPNKAEVTIYNLSEHTRSEFQHRPLRVHLEAGHAGAPRLLFVGDVLPGSGSTLQGVEWATMLKLRDGTRAFAGARSNRSYKPGTARRVILRDLARSLGLDLPRDVDMASDLAAQLASGETLTGYASDELTRLLAPYGYGWSIQNGQLQILRDEDTLAGRARVLEPAPQGGLLGTPTIKVPEGQSKRPTLEADHILDGQLAPGQLIELRARGVNGLFKITKITHAGDTHDQEWTTKIEGRPR